MKKILKQILTGVLAVAMVLTMMPISTPTVQAAEDKTTYEIYPNPHDMSYQGGEFVIRQEVNVVFEKTIDSVTQKRMNEILTSKNKKVTTSQEKVEGKTNILVGTYNSKGYVDTYVQKNYKVDASLFEKFGAHFVASNNGEIVVLGRDTDAAFYGITSLKHIFNQMDGSTIRNFTIKDYADTNIRGFIEGYYGIPWSNEDRMSLMKFGGDFKMTSYIFAPKDDPYHKNKWREPYPAEEIAKIKEMVKVGNDAKCRFVWTAHPFMGGFNANKVDEEIAALLNKFDQLYEAGVRQFGVLGDDVGNLNKDIVIKMMKAVSDWAKKKGDVYDTVFCPAGYNHSWQGDYSELNKYDKEFPDDIKIFWTGEAVCQPVEQKTLNHFRRHNLNGQSERRSPLFWLNWPVNDINGERLMMGKGSLLHTDINVNDLAGVVTNPMQEAEASKVAIFAVADYAWNVKEFDDDKSWADSFKYIDPQASEALHTLAKHMSNPQPNGHGLVLAESEELQPLLNKINEQLNAGKLNEADAKQMIAEMQTIIDACKDFHAQSKNKKLKEELKPFTDSLSALATAIQEYVKAEVAVEADDMFTAFNHYNTGYSALLSSQNCERKMLNGSAMVSPGSTHLIPLAKKLQKKLSGPVNDYATGGAGSQQVKMTATSNISGWHQGPIGNIIDGNDKTHAWANTEEKVGQYFQVEFNKPVTVYGIHIINGANQDNKHQDTFGTAQLKYKVQGSEEWKLVSQDTYRDYAEFVDVSQIELENVVAVRYECTEKGSGNKWPAMREFKVATMPENAENFTKTVIRTSDKEGWKVYSGKETDLVDDNLNTVVHYNVRQQSQPANTTIVGDYVGVKLSKPIVLGKINIAQGKANPDDDYFKHVDLEYSMDNKTWTKIEHFENKRDISIDVSDRNITAQYVRLKNTQQQPNWIAFREFDVDAKIFHNGKVFTNVDKYKKHTADYLADTAEVTPIDNVALAKGEYIGLKLDRIHELAEITSKLSNENLTVQVSKNNVEWKDINVKESKATKVTDDARYVRIINKTEKSITFNIDEFAVKTVEIYPKSVKETNYSEIENPLNVFDGDITTATHYKNSQTKGKSFTYDLGQEIDLKTFKVVCRDSEHDFPRHAKFSVSTDGKTWEEIMTLGNQDKDNEGEATNLDHINTVLPTHEISYNVKKETDINKKARYLKFEITRNKSGDDKWVRFNELEINDGEFMPSENNPTYKSDAEETRNGLFRNMSDGDIATMFVPSKDSGYVQYSLSDNTDVNTIKILQNASAISNATVKARVWKNGKEDWVTVGKLSQSYNEFVLPNDTVLLDVKVEWSKTTPNITELLTYKTEYKTVDKNALKALIDSKEDTTKWTTSTAKVYADAYKAGQEVMESANASQDSVNNAVTAINKAIEGKQLKGDISVLEALVKNFEAEKSDVYTAKTWAVYEKAIDACKAAIENKDDTSEKDVETLKKAVEDAKAGLVYNPTNQEMASIAVETENAFIASITNPEGVYTQNSWKAYVDAKEELEGLLEEHKTTPQHPDKFETALNKLTTAKGNLVELKELPALIAEFDAIKDSSIYTKESFDAYKEAVDNARQLLVNGTEDTIAEAIKNIEDAKANLKLNETADASKVEALLKELKDLTAENYTEKSYNALQKVITEVDGKDLSALSQEELQDCLDQLNDAKQNLVSVEALKEAIASAGKYAADKYTANSYKVLTDAVAEGKALFAAGTREEVSKATTSIYDAMKGLVARANADEVKKYVESIVEKDLSKYTEESAKAYKDALAVLKNMLNDLDNVSATAFTQAKANFEKAEAGLVVKTTIPATKPNNKPNQNDKPVKTGDTANSVFPMLVMIASLAVAGGVLVFRRKRTK
ncbi:MAG: beta-N-acetylglucosaminidase domain-containing protein [Lachnospiraceae bacterium]|nr:beta-N-acetylglucosaminidase domain-containing protein [Lachnospiraceae bacterium]